MDVDEAIQNGLEEIKVRGTSRLIDPAQIKTVNWSRKRKRNKKLWKTTRGRGRTVQVVDDSEALALILAEEAR